MEDAHAVRVRQRVRHRRGDRQGSGGAEAPPVLEPLPQRATIEVRHDVIEEATHLARVVQCQDVRVGEAGGNLDFLQEPLDSEKRGEARQQHLQGDLAPMLAVIREVHGGHAAAAQHATQRVALAERGLEVGGDVVRHGGGI